MTEYRITKYNPANRIDGIYTADEWTSFHDIGKVFGGMELSRDTYLKTEQAYISCCMELMEKAHIRELSVEQAECYTQGLLIPSALSDAGDIRRLIASCLREECWLKLSARDFFIHFGYDYYMYIGSALPCETVKQVAARHGLYCEPFPSPYGQ